MPLWLIGWNSLCFDNTCLLVSAPSQYERYFRGATVRLTSGPKSGYILNIPGVNNVDLFVYLERTQKHRFKNLSLSNVAKEMGGPEKTQMPLSRGSYDTRGR